MKKYNNPEKKLKIIHVAGTNGKGSVTEMMSNILIKCGYKVGKFISPHLIKHNERISINNINIANEDMENMIQELNPIIEEYTKENNKKVTLFELETIMAILYFYKRKCDFVVLEVGLGGLYDCTNIIEPVVSIINSISYDHMKILGNTLEEIAIQKAGIIKKNSSTVFIKQNDNRVNNIIIDTCLKKQNNLHLINEEEITNHSYNNELQKFTYKNYKDISINLKGKIQIYNAALCLETVNVLRESYNIPEDDIREGLKTVIHKARFETIYDKPIIIYDGGHNESAIENFNNSVNMYYKNNKKVFIISILNRKDYKTILKKLEINNNSIYIFTSGNDKERFINKEELYKEANKISKSKNLYKYELAEALNIAKSKYRDRVIFIIGSFYIYKTIIEELNK